MRRYELPREHNVRTRIVEYLAESGTVADASGRATSVLKGAVGYQGSDVGFTQVVAAMAKAGLIRREIRGKRTYRISKSASPDTRDEPAFVTTNVEPLDFGELATALLVRATSLALAPTDTSDVASWAQRRLQNLEVRNASLEQELVVAHAATQEFTAHRDALRVELDAAQDQLAQLSEQLYGGRRSDERAADRLTPDERLMLHRLRLSLPSSSAKTDPAEEPAV
jgi:hypothetical protein